jgi:hypothetical protein
MVRKIRLAVTAVLFVVASGLLGSNCDCPGSQPEPPPPSPSQHSQAGAPLAG